MTGRAVAFGARFALALLLLSIPAWADDCKHPIDIWLDRAIEKSKSTAGQRNTVQQAQAKWDAEMNRVFKKLMERLNAPQRAALQRSQRAWLAYRDAEYSTCAAIMSRKEGTMWLPIRDEKRMDIVKDRALFLADYDRLLDE